MDKGGKSILRSVSLTLRPGLNYLIGLNGSGKSTLLRVLARLEPCTGSVWLDRRPIALMPARQLARHITLVHQRINIPFKVRLGDYVLMGRYPYLNWWGSYTAEDHAQVQATMERLQIGPLAERHLDEVSGGELQKAFIARALVQQAPILLLDEPAQSLDPRNKAQLYALLAELAAAGKTLLCSTHDLDALSDSDAHVFALRDGSLCWQGQAQAATRDFLMTEVYRDPLA